MKNIKLQIMDALLPWVKDHIYMILGGLCVVLVGVVYLFGRGEEVRVIPPEDIIYRAADENVFTDPFADAFADTAEDNFAEAAEDPPEDALEYVESPPDIIVHIVGEVVNPGVFTLPFGSRADDALQMAGGGTLSADLSQINLAATLQDGMQIRIPAFGEEGALALPDTVLPNTATTTPLPAAEDNRVNLNTATLAELQTLPGVGPVIANNIIDFRDRHGHFTTIDELQQVDRIGAATMERLRDLVRI